VPSALSAVFTLRIRNDIATILSLISSFVWLAIVLGVSLSNAGIIAVSLGYAAVTALTALTYFMSTRRMIALGPSDARLERKLLSSSLPVGLAFVLVISYGRIDQILVFTLAGSRDAGLYGAVYKLLDQSLLAPILLLNTLFPVLAASFPGNLQKVRTVVSWAAHLLLTIAAGLLAVSIVARVALVHALYGEPFVGAADALPILMLAFVFAAMTYLTGKLVIVLGLERRLVVYATIGLLVNIALNVVLVPTFGFIAAAWVTVGTEMLVLALIGAPIIHRLDLRLRFGRATRIAAAAGALTLTLAVISLARPPLAVLLLCAVVLYPALLLAMRAFRPAELQLLLSVRDDRP
jgi:O-antigen/teichoic acid export membrane protein